MKTEISKYTSSTIKLNLKTDEQQAKIPGEIKARKDSTNGLEWKKKGGDLMVGEGGALAFRDRWKFYGVRARATAPTSKRHLG